MLHDEIARTTVTTAQYIHKEGGGPEGRKEGRKEGRQVGRCALDVLLYRSPAGICACQYHNEVAGSKCKCTAKEPVFGSVDLEAQMKRSQRLHDNFVLAGVLELYGILSDTWSSPVSCSASNVLTVSISASGSTCPSHVMEIHLHSYEGFYSGRSQPLQAPIRTRLHSRYRCVNATYHPAPIILCLHEHLKRNDLSQLPSCRPK